MPILTLIVDDEPLARERILSLLENEPGVEVVGECGDGRSAAHAIKRKRLDLVLLDIQLPELDGFEIVESMDTAQPPAIVFVTAYDQFALKAFKVHALDYLLKPVDGESLHQALLRVRAHKPSGIENLRQQLSELRHEMSERATVNNRIAVKTDKAVLFFRASEIDWIESAGSYVCFHVGSKSYISRETMHQVEQNLQKHNFVRIHRSTIVNLERIKKLKLLAYGEYQVELCDGTALVISRGCKEEVLRKIGYV